mgnify:CR=1 FL=1
MRQPRYLNAGLGKSIGDIMGRRLAIDSQVHRENDFAQAARLGPRHQAGDVEILRSDPVKRGKPAAEDMIAAFEGTRPFQRPQVGHILDHA